MPPAPIKFNQCFWEEYLGSQTATLPHLQNVEHFSNLVTRVMGDNPGPMQLQGTNTYLLGRGRSKILIDTAQGMPGWIRTLSALLKEQDWEITHVLLTHWHGDHVGGIPDLIQFDPSLSTRLYKNKPDSGQNPIHDSQVFRADGVTLRAVYTPGHAIDHMCFVLEEENALFTGDNILGHGNSVAEDLGTYMNSLEVMHGLACSLGYPAHGKEISNLPAKLEASIRAKVLHENQIHAALLDDDNRNDNNDNDDPQQKDGALGSGRRSMTTQELVEKMYGQVPEDAYSLAIEPVVTETLWKLTEDRKVGFENRAGNRRWFATADRPDSVVA